jgi:hypothetical protein
LRFNHSNQRGTGQPRRLKHYSCALNPGAPRSGDAKIATDDRYVEALLNVVKIIDPFQSDLDLDQPHSFLSALS